MLVLLAAVPLVARRLPVGWTVTALGLAAVVAGLTASGLPPGLLRPATAQETLLGFDLPGPPTVLGLIGPGRVNVLADVVCLVLAGAYVAGVLRLRRRGDAWPPGRTTAWLGGVRAAGVDHDERLRRVRDGDVQRAHGQPHAALDGSCRSCSCSAAR